MLVIRIFVRFPSERSIFIARVGRCRFQGGVIPPRTMLKSQVAILVLIFELFFVLVVR